MSDATFSTAEIADALDAPRGAVMSRLSGASGSWLPLLRVSTPDLGSGRRRSWTARQVVVISMLEELRERGAETRPGRRGGAAPICGEPREKLAAELFAAPWGQPLIGVSFGRFEVLYLPDWELPARIERARQERAS